MQVSWSAAPGITAAAGWYDKGHVAGAIVPRNSLLVDQTDTGLEAAISARCITTLKRRRLELGGCGPKQAKFKVKILYFVE